MRPGRRVEFPTDHRDRMVLRLAALGKPIKYIARVTQYTPAMVAYRLRRAQAFRLNRIRQGTDQHKIQLTLERDARVQKLIDKRITEVLEKERVVINGRMQPVQNPEKATAK